MKHMSRPWPNPQGVLLSIGLIAILTTAKLTAALLAPFLLAMSLAIILDPFVKKLTFKYMPTGLVILSLLILGVLPILAIGSYLATEMAVFSANFGTLKTQFYSWLSHVEQSLHHLGVTYSRETLQQLLTSSNAANILHNIVLEASNQLSNVMMIFALVIFMLLESCAFQNKLTHMAHHNPCRVDALNQLVTNIKHYFLIKLQTSLLTACCIYLVLFFFGIKYMFLWAALAFFLNFIPVIGSIIAAIPPILLALIEISPITALSMAACYLIIEVLIGNFIEPKLMGKSLGISTLVVFISMSFWGWLLGPTGMILSVPLTMCLQSFFKQFQQTQWLALLFSHGETS
jgi:AI-2 transport protein TqsA